MSRTSSVRLGDLVNIKHGFAFKGQHFSEVPTPFVLLTPGNFRIGGGFKADKLKYYCGPVPPDYVLSPGDLVVSMTDLSKNMDTLGSPALVPRLGGGQVVLHNQRIGLLQPKTADIDLPWLSYRLRAADYRAEVLASATGTTVHHTSPGRIQGFELLLPAIEEQRLIAATLQTLDEKIEWNRRIMAKVLELGTALLAESLTYGFDSVGLDEVANFQNRRRIPLSQSERATRPGPYPYYGATGVFGSIDDFIFDEILVLIGEDGSVVQEDGSPFSQYIWGKSWINNHAHAIHGKGISTELLYLLLRGADVRPLVTGAVQPKLNMGNLKSLCIELPVGSKLATLESRLSDLFNLFRARADEAKTLERLRDSLLPELLSGDRVLVVSPSEVLA